MGNNKCHTLCAKVLIIHLFSNLSRVYSDESAHLRFTLCGVPLKIENEKGSLLSLGTLRWPGDMKCRFFNKDFLIRIKKSFA